MHVHVLQAAIRGKQDRNFTNAATKLNAVMAGKQVRDDFDDANLAAKVIQGALNGHDIRSIPSRVSYLHSTDMAWQVDCVAAESGDAVANIGDSGIPGRSRLEKREHFRLRAAIASHHHTKGNLR